MAGTRRYATIHCRTEHLDAELNEWAAEGYKLVSHVTVPFAAGAIKHVVVMERYDGAEPTLAISEQD